MYIEFDNGSTDMVSNREDGTIVFQGGVTNYVTNVL